MKLEATETFTLSNFEGPIELLFQLVTRQEIDIYAISLHQLIDQFIEITKKAASVNLDKGAEFIAMASLLVWYKSKMLLPKHEQQDEEALQEEADDPRFEIIHQLIDYCLFKQAAKTLSHLEIQQSAFYSRGTEESEIKKNLGIEHISLEDLANLFKEILAKSTVHKGLIHEEVWRVSDKIMALRALLKETSVIEFEMVFTYDKSREELIVTFLALLEMMKSGEAKVARPSGHQKICIMRG
jgi:segregation and condensation protein A